jgi:aspartyl-tRNA(Asn)/glutamyl-tRNA(Gln) amidotransferase subunit B
MRSGAEAVEYAKTAARAGGVAGHLRRQHAGRQLPLRRQRVGAPPGAPFGTRREIKNLNSFRFLQQAVDFEVQWQIDQIEDGLAIQQATVLFNPDTGETRAMRSKEDAHDYRYFPDPDLPPLVIAPEWVERVRAELPELPARWPARFVQRTACPPTTRDDDARAWRRRASTRRRATPAWQPKLVANWLMGEVSAAERRGAGHRRQRRWRRHAGRADRPHPTAPSPTTRARQVFDALWTGQSTDVDAVIEAKGLKQMSDSGALERIVDAVLAANPSRSRSSAPARTRPSTPWSAR